MESDSVCNHTSDYKIVGVRFVNHEYDYRPTSDDTKSTYHLIIKITIFEKHKKYKNTFDEIIMLEYRVPDH